MLATPAPPSFADRLTETGELVYQPLEQAEPLHWIELLGAVPSAVTGNELAAELRPALFVAVPLEVGSVPSVVYLTFASPAPPSVADRVTETGELVYQPLEQPAPLHWIDVLGAVPSAVTVNELAVELRPALLVALTL